MTFVFSYLAKLAQIDSKSMADTKFFPQDGSIFGTGPHGH